MSDMRKVMLIGAALLALGIAEGEAQQPTPRATPRAVPRAEARAERVAVRGWLGIVFRTTEDEEAAVVGNVLRDAVEGGAVDAPRLAGAAR